MRRVVEKSGYTYVQITNIIMERGIALPWQDLEASDLPHIRDEMIQLVTTLHHEYRVVHGDIKPDHFIRWKDGKLRLCDFAESRRIDKSPKKWCRQAAVMYTSPNRRFLDVGAAPTISDDLFALGLCIWQIYTKRRPFPPDMDEDDIQDCLRKGEVVEVMEIEDTETREIVSGYLAQGGAIIRS